MKTLLRASGPPTLLERAAGVLLHPTSLPTDYAIGDLGPQAFAFIDFMAAAGLRWWQMLPVGPVGDENSPYQSFSAFAGNSLLISPDGLLKDGLIRQTDLAAGCTAHKRRVDFKHAASFKQQILRKAFATFKASSNHTRQRALATFRRREATWLSDYALFNAIRNRHGDDWTAWPAELRNRQPAAMSRIAQECADDVFFFAFREWIFARQWSALRTYAAARGIGLIGDVPIFVSPKSCDVWANSLFFDLRPNGQPRIVAGVPPDYFAKTGQRWGNPHYQWTALKRKQYSWWVQRFRQNLRDFDVVRLDHFIGFIRYYEIPGEAATAEHGHYRKGPGADFFAAILRALKLTAGQPPRFIAEDLGTVTPEVKALRDTFHFPGMKVLQFAFGLDPEARHYQPHAYPRHAVAYTGTHDNDTTVGWFRDKSSAATTRSAEAIEQETALTLTYLGCLPRDIHWAMIRAAFGSVANTAIVPMQDFLGLGSWARMNRPGIASGNWNWRLDPTAITPALSNKIRELTSAYARI